MTDTNEQYPDLPGYESPPVFEVVTGLSFDRLERFKIPYFGLLWEKLRQEFPSCEHAPPLDVGQNLSDDPVTKLPLPRVWYINETKERLIQVQMNRFLYNWRKLESAHIYPSFSKLKDEFHHKFKLYLEFLDEINLSPPNYRECELTYINHIPQGMGWESPEDVPSIFPDLGWRLNKDRFLNCPEYISGQLNFPLPDKKGNLFVKLQSANLRILGTPLLIFELSARGLGKDQTQEGIKQWFETAHEWICKSL